MMPSEMKYIVLDLQAKDEGIAIIKINRPDVLNALNKETMSELSTAIDIVGADDKIAIFVGGLAIIWISVMSIADGFRDRNLKK